MRRQLAQALHRDRHGRVVQRLLLGQFGQHRQGEAQAAVVATQPRGDLGLGAAALHRQHLAGQVALVRSQFVAQHATGDRVPAAVDLQRVDLLEQPRHLQGFAQAEVDLGHVHRLELAGAGQFDDVERRLQELQLGQLLRQCRRQALLLPLPDAGLVSRALRIRQHARGDADVVERPLVALDRGGDARHRARTVQQPAHERTLQLPDHFQGIDLHGLGQGAVERVDLGPQRARVQRLAADGVGLGDLGHAAAGVFLHAHQEGGAHAVDGLVGHRGGDDLALQAVAVHRVGVLLLQRLREVAQQLLGQVRVLRDVRFQQLLEGDDLGVGQQHRQLRTGQALATHLARGQFGIGRQELDLAIEQALLLQRADEVLLGTQALDAHPLHQADGLVLAVVVHQHQPGDLVGHRRQQLVALFDGELLGAHHVVEQDLDVDLVVGGINAGGVVDEVGVEQHAVMRGLDAAELGHAQVAALAHDLAAQLAAVDAQAVVGAVADIGVALAGRLYVGADAAVPHQVHRRLERGVDQLGRGHRLDAGVDAQRLAHLRGDLDRLERARIHAAALADQLGVIVRPARTRHLEHARALLEGGRGHRVRVEEDVAVVERAHQADVLGQQHAVAEHVAGHVADADHGEVLLLAIAAQRAEVALDRLPRTTRGDAHALVVVTHRAARGEGVVQPEAMRAGDAVGGVGERRGALVGGDHQVRVVLVVAHHALRRHDLVADYVVGDVQQAVDEALVAGHALGEPGVTVQRRVRQLLGVETALGADRHDHRVLHHLRLDQAQHLGAEILAAVGPAQAATGHRAEAQVGALHARAAHEDLAVRARLGQVRHLGGVELEADVVGRAAVGTQAVLARHVVAGAQRGLDHADEAAQDAVFVQAGHAVQQLDQGVMHQRHARIAVAATRLDHALEQLDGGGIAAGQRLELHQLRVGGGLVGGRRRVEAGFEQLHDQPRQQRVAVEGAFDVGLRERHADLQQVLAVAAQHRHLAPVQAGGQHQAVEAVVLGLAVPHPGKGLGEGGAGGGRVDRADGRFDLEVLHVDRRVIHHQPVRALGDHAQAHVLHHRQHVGQRDVLELAVQLHAQAVAAVTVDGLQAQAQVVRAGERIELGHVGGGDLGAGVLDVAGRQRLADARGDAQALAFAVARDQRLAQVVLPVAQHVGQALLQALGVQIQALPGLGAHDQVHLGQRRIAQHHARIHVLTLQRLAQQALDAQAHVGVEAFARQEHQRGNETTELVAAQEQAAAHALLQPQHAHRGTEQFVLAGLEQLLARQRLEDVAQRLAAVAGRAQARTLHHVLVALAHQRDFPRAAVVGAGGEQAEEALFADDAALGVEFQHADVIHVAAAVDPRAGVGLGQDQRVGQAAGGVQALRGQPLDRARHRGVLAAHQAQAGAVLGGQHVLAALLLHLVLTVAEEGEMVVRGPAQELLRLVARLIAHRQGALAQVFGQGQRLVAHRLPVLDDGTHVLQRFTHALGHRVHGLGRLAVDLQQHHRLQRAVTDAGQLAGLVAAQRDHRVAQHVHADAHVGQRQRNGVHQERHVVIDDLQHGVGGFPAIGLQARIEHADVGLARLAHAGELQHAGGQRRPVLGTVRAELIRFHALVEGRSEGDRLGLGRGGVTLAQGRKNRLQGQAGLGNTLLGSRLGFRFCGLGSVVLRFHG